MSWKCEHELKTEIQSQSSQTTHTIVVPQEEPPRKFIVKGLAEAFTDLNKLLKESKNMAPNTERFLLLERSVQVHYLLISQSMMEKKKTHQANQRGHIFKRVTPPQEEPQAGPEEGVPDSGPVITDDSSPRAVAPEDLAVGQDVHVRTVTLTIPILCKPRTLMMCVCVCVFVLTATLQK